MSLEKATAAVSEPDRASPRTQELNRRFRRPEAPPTPPTKQRSPVQQQTLPKVLSQIAKVQSAAAPAEAEQPKHSAADSNGVSSYSEPTRDERIAEPESEHHHSSVPAPSQQIQMQRPQQIISPSEHLVGLNLLQEQVRRLALRKGFTLNIMVVGTADISCKKQPES